ncbi:MAG TPA: hypothetical protein VIN09_09740 [Chloroflexota bacterium]
MSDTLRLICTLCGRRLWGDGGSPCPECGGPLRPMGRLEGLVDRWFGPPDEAESDLHRRHLQLIELLWSADGRGLEYYNIVRPRVSFGRFVHQVTELVCRGIEEGWIDVQMPRAPSRNRRDYQIRFLDPERFVDEMVRLFDQK